MSTTPTVSEAESAVINLLTSKFKLSAGTDFVVKGEEKNQRTHITVNINGADPNQSQELVSLANSKGFHLHIVNNNTEQAAA